MSKHLLNRLLEQPFFNNEINDLIKKYPCGLLANTDENKIPFWNKICNESYFEYINLLDNVVEKFKIYNRSVSDDEIDDAYIRLSSIIYNKFIKDTTNDNSFNENCLYCVKKCTHTNAVNVLAKLGAFLMMYENFIQENKDELNIESDDEELSESDDEELSESDDEELSESEEEELNESEEESDDEELNESDDEKTELLLNDEEKELFNKFCESFNLIKNTDENNITSIEIEADFKILSPLKEKYNRNDNEIKQFKKKALDSVSDKISSQLKLLLFEDDK